APEIFNLIRNQPDELVPRSRNDILQNIDRSLVAVRKGVVVGTVSWAILPEPASAKHPSMEIRSVAVNRMARNLGAGRALIEAAIERIAILKPEQIIVLTFVPDFFRKFGFGEVPKEKLMHKIYTGCLNCTRYDSPFTCPEIAMSLVLNPPAAD
ncbi:MAG: GNAT family N-acetyltransferase, partial [Kiritimatiellia bacterium]|nr:GNAT family N-acetyltransferase [Kiritimatiellia bacterium]